MGNMLTTLGQEIAGLTQKNENIDITTNRDEHNKYQDMVSKDLVKDVEFALSLNDNQIDRKRGLAPFLLNDVNKEESK
jgi:hypothetical protein